MDQTKTGNGYIIEMQNIKMLSRIILITKILQMTPLRALAGTIFSKHIFAHCFILTVATSM